MNDIQTQIAADNCEVIRARLAKYEDDQGNPVGRQLSGVMQGDRSLLSKAAAQIEYLAECLENVTEDDPEDGTAESLTEAREIAEQISAALSAPNHSEQVRELPPFAQKVISKLKRFEECASDSDAGGVDIGRHWLDLLTQLGLLNRVQRSPGLWEISQQGEDVLAAAPSAGSQGGDV